MPTNLLYLDSSALVKLVIPEAETSALLALLADWPRRLSSDLAAVEVARASRKASRDPAVYARAAQVIAGLHLLRINEPIIRSAGDLEPLQLRSLDAIHLASALSLGSDLQAMVVYDEALARAARHHGLRVLAPA